MMLLSEKQVGLQFFLKKHNLLKCTLHILLHFVLKLIFQSYRFLLIKYVVLLSEVVVVKLQVDRGRCQQNPIILILTVLVIIVDSPAVHDLFMLLAF